MKNNCTIGDSNFNEIERTLSNGMHADSLSGEYAGCKVNVFFSEGKNKDDAFHETTGLLSAFYAKASMYTELKKTQN